MFELTLIMATYRRFALVHRSVASILGQTDPRWRLKIIHDGPTKPRQLEKLRALDSRIEAWSLGHHVGDWGQSPRLAGLKNTTGYVAFWDDDNWYAPFAVSDIVRAIDQTDGPDLLLMPSTLLHSQKPPKDRPLNQLIRGDIDQSMIVCRAEIARTYLPPIRLRKERTGEDFALFQAALENGKVVRSWPGRSICRYDGARTLSEVVYRSPFLLHLWGALKHHRRRFLALR